MLALGAHAVAAVVEPALGRAVGAYIVMVEIVMAYVVMSYVVMAYLVMVAVVEPALGREVGKTGPM